jgi:hypothetical protein
MTPARIFAVLLLLATAAPSAVAESVPQNTPTQAAGPATSVPQVVDRLIEREKETVKLTAKYHPLVETYLQNVRPDPELGVVPVSDQYYLGRLDLTEAVPERFYTGDRGTDDKRGNRILHALDITRVTADPFKSGLGPLGFTGTIFPDAQGFDRSNYYFQFVRREFLGDVRCLLFQVVPKEDPGHGGFLGHVVPKKGSRHGRFLGRIWVEDKDYNIVRFNGSYQHPERDEATFHMDSWRSNVQPGVWLPSEVYSEEGDLRPGQPKDREQFKAQTRLWGYKLNMGARQEEFTQMTIEQASGPVKDESEAAADWSPVVSLRHWQRSNEENVLDRLQQAGLLAAASPVDDVLMTVVNNLIITNNLDLPEVHCRVLVTTPLETFTVGDTIVVSRGLLDVLPDEPSLAMVLSHELAHIVLGDQETTKYAFGDRVWTADEDIFSDFNFQRTPAEEQAADKKAIELLKSSPYKDKLASAGLFLRQLEQRAPAVPHLSKARLGNRWVDESRVLRMPELMNDAPQLEMRKLEQVAALPLGGRIKLDPWSNGVSLTKTKSVHLLSFREKMPLEIAPVMPHLTRLDTGNNLAANVDTVKRPN